MVSASARINSLMILDLEIFSVHYDKYLLLPVLSFHIFPEDLIANYGDVNRHSD